MKDTPSGIFILPLDDIPAGVVEAAARGVEREFRLRPKVLDAVPLPVASFNTDRQQYLSLMIIEEIERMDIGTPLLAITSEDLYAQGLNFVFGEADQERGIAVISIARLMQEFYGGSPDPSKLEERAEKEAVHEVGHLLGAPHCNNPECVMRYSNTISHTDRKSNSLCTHCRHRLTLKTIF